MLTIPGEPSIAKCRSQLTARMRACPQKDKAEDPRIFRLTQYDIQDNASSMEWPRRAVEAAGDDRITS